MFLRYGKKPKSSQTKPLNELTRFTPAALMLAEEKRDVLMQQIRGLCALDESRYDSLCLSLIHNLVNHCQNLPETVTSYYAQQGGLVDHALNRTEAALSLFQQYLVVEPQSELSEEQKLWQYALFSAAILQGIGKLQIEFNVGLYDNNGEFLKSWNPLLENMVTVGSYYKYELQPESDEVLRCRLNLLIARLIMPVSGFAWIASNPQVLAIWLALLNEDVDGAGTLGAILIRSDAIAIQPYFSQLALRAYGSRGGRYGRMGTFTGVVPSDSIAEIEQQIGIEFLQWLTKSLESGLIMINKAPLLMVPGGLLMSVEMFRLFVREHPEYKNWQAIQNGFLSLGMHRLGADGSVNSRFEQNSNQQMHTGIVFEKYAVVLPAEFKVINLHTGKDYSTTATEFLNDARSINNNFTSQQAAKVVASLPHLNASGQWLVDKSPVAHASSLRVGLTHDA